MATKKFHSAYDAAMYATSLADEWKDENEKLLSKDGLLGYMKAADEDYVLDEDDEECYYIVDESGAIGLTNDGEASVYWAAKPTKTG